MEYFGNDQVNLKYKFPLSEIVSKFYDKLKSVSSGYASFDYDRIADRAVDLCHLVVLLNKEPCDGLAVIVPACVYFFYIFFLIL